jgi:hypothetical protein
MLETQMTEQPEEEYPAIRALLEPGEQLAYRAQAVDAVVALTDRRLAVIESERIALAVDIAHVRRVQFDIEKERPATLSIVPEHPLDVPQSLGIAPEHYDEVATLLVVLGKRLATVS